MPATVIRLPVVFRAPLSEPLPPTPHPVAHDPLLTWAALCVISFGAGAFWAFGVPWLWGAFR